MYITQITYAMKIIEIFSDKNIKKIHFRLNVQLKNITFAYVIYVSVCVFENSNNTKERTSIHTLKLQRFQVK
jgi:hypothetical protein